MKYPFQKSDRNRALSLLLIASLLMLVAAVKVGTPLGSHEDFGGKAETVVRDVPYVPSMAGNPDLMLDVHSNPHEGLQPVIVMVHGGGWYQGSKEMDNKVWICKVMAANGYVAFTINYRLLPEARLKKQAEDVMAAVIWVKEHAKEYGGDPGRIGVIGGSAGGHLGALVAWASDDPWFTPTGDPQSQYDSDVQVAALYYPVIDLKRTFKENGGLLGSSVVPLLVGGRGESAKESLRHLSPHNHVDAADPPTIFLCGDADELKLQRQSLEYSALLRTLGVDSEVYLAPGKLHGFTWNYWEPESVESVRRIVEFFDKYLKG